MTHEDLQREDIVKLGSERRFGQVFAAVFAIAGLITFWHSHAYWPAWFVASAVTLALAYAAPDWLRGPNRLWMKFGLLLKRIIQPIVMALLFFVAVTPIALIMRLKRADLLRLKFEKGQGTYWLKRDRAPNPMNKQF